MCSRARTKADTTKQFLASLTLCVDKIKYQFIDGVVSHCLKGRGTLYVVALLRSERQFKCDEFVYMSYKNIILIKESLRIGGGSIPFGHFIEQGMERKT